MYPETHKLDSPTFHNLNLCTAPIPLGTAITTVNLHTSTAAATTIFFSSKELWPTDMLPKEEGQVSKQCVTSFP